MHSRRLSSHPWHHIGTWEWGLSHFGQRYTKGSPSTCSRLPADLGVKHETPAPVGTASRFAKPTGTKSGQEAAETDEEIRAKWRPQVAFTEVKKLHAYLQKGHNVKDELVEVYTALRQMRLELTAMRADNVTLRQALNAAAADMVCEAWRDANEWHSRAACRPRPVGRRSGPIRSGPQASKARQTSTQQTCVIPLVR